MSNLTPKRPYLLRAFYDWIVDNGMTPHLLVDAESDQVIVPRDYVKDGKIVLNVSPSAANALMMQEEEVSFSARFNGRAFSIWLPIWSVMAIYSKETQDGISFPTDEYLHSQPDTDSSPENETVTPALSLAAVKGDTVSDVVEDGQDDTSPADSKDGDDDEPPPPPKPGKRPALRVVK